MGLAQTGRLALLQELAAKEALAVSGVTKIYPGRMGREPLTAVQDVSFSVRAGEILSLLGPNGAGKTTTIKMIAGLLLPSAGTIQVGGVDVSRHRRKAVERLGAVLEGNRNLHWKLTVRENLDYFGALKGVRDLPARSDRLIARLDLGDHLKKRVGELSRGLQQRVAIAIALVNEPHALLLDEPTLGLDVVAAAGFKETVRAIAQDGCGIVLTTHQMEVAQELSDRVAIIAGGRLATLDTLDQLMTAHRTPGYAVRVRGAIADATKDAVLALGASGVEVESTVSRVEVPEGDPDTLYRVLGPLREAHHELLGIEQHAVNLEDIYRRVIGAQA